jgi:hypothetical protein
MPIDVQYLRVIGRLYADRQLALRPGYLTTAPPWTDLEGEGPLWAQTIDAGGRLLGRFPLRLNGVCAEPSPSTEPQAVRGFVPFHAEARQVVFTYEGAPILELARHDEPPRVELSWQPEARMAGRHRVTWDARAADGAPVQFFLRYSIDAGASWNRIGTRTDQLAQEVDFDDLPGGDECRLAVVATDGIDTAVSESGSFAVERKPCVAIILEPAHVGTYRHDAPVPLLGQGFWRERAEPEWEHLQWFVGDDEQPVAGGRRADIVLPPGQHSITLRAGGEPYQGRAEAQIVVEEAREG